MGFQKINRRWQISSYSSSLTGAEQGSAAPSLPVLYAEVTTEVLQSSIDSLQTELLKKGYLSSTNGIFDVETETAVKAFQRDNELTADGVVGHLTWAALLHPTLRRTDSLDPNIREQIQILKTLLNKEGLKVDDTDYFGPKTDRAVRKFQKRYGLNPDGVCGPLTWALLLGESSFDTHQTYIDWKLLIQTILGGISLGAIIGSVVNGPKGSLIGALLIGAGVPISEIIRQDTSSE